MNRIRLTRPALLAIGLAVATVATGAAGIAAASQDGARTTLAAQGETAGTPPAARGETARTPVLGIAQVAEQLAAAGYVDIREIEREHDRYEVKARDAQGTRVELDVDAHTGAVLRARHDD